MEHPPREEILNLSEESEYALQSRISQQEILFRQFIESKLLYSFSKELETFKYSDAQLEDFYRFFGSLKHNDKLTLLAFPWELKQRAFPTFKKKIDSGEINIQEAFTKILEASKSQSRHVAYHCSNQEINPGEENDGQGKKVKTWVIKGTEKDHRDDDLPMAYYSFDYHNLYRTKNPKFIYIVSIQTHEKSGHRKDGNMIWGRAPSLTVIDKIDIKEADEYINEKQKENPEEKKQAA